MEEVLIERELNEANSWDRSVIVMESAKILYGLTQGHSIFNLVIEMLILVPYLNNKSKGLSVCSSSG